MSLEIAEIEAQLERLWSEYTVSPQHIGMSIGNLRRLACDRPMRDDVQAFIDAHPDAPDDVTVIISDRAGNPVHFAEVE